MPAGTDLIFFDTPEDWESIVSTSRVAQKLPGDRFVPIPSFDLGVTLNDDYIAVVAGTTEGKPNWFFAGDIAQVYEFSPASGNPVLGKIQPRRFRLGINRLQLLETNRVSVDNFRLQYTPPYWFRDCTIRVYRYTGDRLNFVEDALFNIGNALGVDPNQGESLISSQLQVIEELISDKFLELQVSREAEEQLDGLREEAIRAEINRLGSGLNLLASGIADLLPPEQAEQLRNDANSTFNSDLGFI